MIEFYIYRHIRLDTKMPFYVGKGSKDTEENSYKRANWVHQRNNLWNKIKNKTPYVTEIMYTSLNEKEINEKEIEFIALYGKIIDGTGSLSNMTIGGDGAVGRITTEETIKKHRLNKLGKKDSEETKKNKSFAKINDKIFIESLIKRNKTITSASFTKEHRKNLSESHMGKTASEETRKKLSDIRSNKPIIQTSVDGIFIKEWKSAAEIKRVLNFENSNIARACMTKKNIIRNRANRTAYGFKWYYKDNN